MNDCAECWLYTDERITRKLKENSTVIVAIMNTKGNIRKVMDILKKEGFNDIVPYAKLADIYGDKFHFLYLEDEASFMKRSPEIETARKILLETGADERSILVFDGMVKFRRNKNYYELPELDSKEEQYFPRDIKGYWTENISFVDCGAYIGDTFLALLKYAEDTKATIKCYYGFEPDQENYNILETTVKEKNQRYEVYPYAVCDEKKKLYFNMRGTTASKVDYANADDEKIEVDGVSIDDIHFQVIPSHIKMDIEGSEWMALEGAKSIIQMYKPKLAICIYHKAEDIYSIIKKIHSWNLGYKFEMRVYEEAGVDLVLYAV